LPDVLKNICKTIAVVAPQKKVASLVLTGGRFFSRFTLFIKKN